MTNRAHLLVHGTGTIEIILGCRKVDWLLRPLCANLHQQNRRGKPSLCTRWLHVVGDVNDSQCHRTKRECHYGDQEHKDGSLASHHSQAAPRLAIKSWKVPVTSKTVRPILRCKVKKKFVRRISGEDSSDLRGNPQRACFSGERNFARRSCHPALLQDRLWGRTSRDGLSNIPVAVSSFRGRRSSR